MKTLREQIACRCVHFNGLGKDKCRAGMAYDEVDKDKRLPMRAALPCFKPDIYLPAGVVQCYCPHVQFHTEEEILAQLKEHEESVAKMKLALKVIEPIRKEHKGKNWRGTLECPNCKGKLHVSHAGCNGHVHAKCETPDCVAWME